MISFKKTIKAWNWIKNRLKNWIESVNTEKYNEKKKLHKMIIKTSKGENQNKK
jgi:hypothetical protein